MPEVIDRYFATLRAHDWRGMRECLSDDFTRVGPYEDHDFRGPDEYVDYLAGIVPTFEGHRVEVTRVVDAGPRVDAVFTETIEWDGEPRPLRLMCAFDLDGDGRIARLEVFVRRPTPAER